jgi:hypothetical protein
MVTIFSPAQEESMKVVDPPMRQSLNDESRGLPLAIGTPHRQGLPQQEKKEHRNNR